MFRRLSSDSALSISRPTESGPFRFLRLPISRTPISSGFPGCQFLRFIPGRYSPRSTTTTGVFVSLPDGLSSRYRVLSIEIMFNGTRKAMANKALSQTFNIVETIRSPPAFQMELSSSGHWRIAFSACREVHMIIANRTESSLSTEEFSRLVCCVIVDMFRSRWIAKDSVHASRILRQFVLKNLGCLFFRIPI